MNTTADPTAMYTNEPTVIPVFGARHIDAGDHTACGILLDDCIRYEARDDQRISCRYCYFGKQYSDGPEGFR